MDQLLVQCFMNKEVDSFRVLVYLGVWVRRPSMKQGSPSKDVIWV
jgi:hypothetical protein